MQIFTSTVHDVNHSLTCREMGRRYPQMLESSIECSGKLQRQMNSPCSRASPPTPPRPIRHHHHQKQLLSSRLGGCPSTRSQKDPPPPDKPHTKKSRTKREWRGNVNTKHYHLNVTEPSPPHPLLQHSRRSCVASILA